tara:strand:+ start:1749 stop:2363 length:615 start_codon:yes stop_codon:yes gene_type:complete
MIKHQIKFREIKVSDAKKILNWRRKERITNFQFTDIKNSLKLQKKWILASYKKKSYYHWLTLYRNKPIGFISINGIDLKKLETTWSWYVGEEKYFPLGGYIPPYFYNWVFNNFKINKIYANVFVNNYNVIQIHKLHGYKSLKKVYTKKKKDKNIKYIKMVLSKKNWNFKKYAKYVTGFPISKWKIIKNNEKKNFNRLKIHAKRF